jgi:hypothetical protein
VKQSLADANQQIQSLVQQLNQIKGTFDNIENGYSKANLILGIISGVCSIIAVIISIVGCSLKMKEYQKKKLYLEKAESTSSIK